jgi:hypothetical protein
MDKAQVKSLFQVEILSSESNPNHQNWLFQDPSSSRAKIKASTTLLPLREGLSTYKPSGTWWHVHHTSTSRQLSPKKLNFFSLSS